MDNFVESVCYSFSTYLLSSGTQLSQCPVDFMDHPRVQKEGRKVGICDSQCKQGPRHDTHDPYISIYSNRTGKTSGVGPFPSICTFIQWM